MFSQDNRLCVVERKTKRKISCLMVREKTYSSTQSTGKESEQEHKKKLYVTTPGEDRIDTLGQQHASAEPAIALDVAFKQLQTFKPKVVLHDFLASDMV